MIVKQDFRGRSGYLRGNEHDPTLVPGPGAIVASMTPRTIGIDGDDTLWESEAHFVTTTAKMVDLLSNWVHSSEAVERLMDVERRNLKTLGYGVNAFALSMIQTAIEVTNSEVSAPVIHQIIEWAKELMSHPVDLLDGVPEALESLAEVSDLLLITKGDLLHQESKVARSGLAEFFRAIHIVSEKDPRTYQRILDEHDVRAEEFMMVGNSMRSDVLPVVQLGGVGVYIPHNLTWELENVHEDNIPDEVVELRCLGDVASLLE